MYQIDPFTLLYGRTLVKGRLNVQHDTGGATMVFRGLADDLFGE